MQRSNNRIEQSNKMNEYFDGNLFALVSYYGLHTEALSRWWWRKAKETAHIHRHAHASYKT